MTCFSPKDFVACGGMGPPATSVQEAGFHVG